MYIKIRHLSGPMAGETQEFSPALSRVTVGRFPSAHIRYPVDLLQVGVEHLELCRDGERYRIQLNRYDPVWVNGEQAMNGHFLVDGDELTLGHRRKGPSLSVSYDYRKNRSKQAQKSESLLSSLIHKFRHARVALA